MPVALTIKQVPDRIAANLRRRAEANRRSLRRELLLIVERAAAVLFDEPDAAPVVASVGGRLIAPTLIRYEIASVCTTKLIRHPGQADAIDARYHRLLERLALTVDATLVTLDSRLAAAWDDASAHPRSGSPGRSRSR